MRSANSLLLFAALLAAPLAGCDLLQGEDPAKVAAAKEADSKAIGAACRHSGRALEDCYVMNPKALRASVYAGWLEMDGYMRDNKIPAVVPDLVEPPVGAKAAAKADDSADKLEAKPAVGEEKKPAAEKKKAAKGAAYLAPAQPLPRRTT